MSASTAILAAGRQGSSPPPRERILAAARELFYRRGIHAVGVDAIAEAAGTNKMTLYRHFASKDVLIAACLRELQQDFDVAWDASAAAHVAIRKASFWPGCAMSVTSRRTRPSAAVDSPTLRSNCRTRTIRCGASSGSIKPNSANG